MLISAVVLGVALGLASGGRLGRLARLRLRWPALLVVAVLARAAAPAVPVPPVALYLGSFVAILAVVLLNLSLPGIALVGAGAALNLLVVAANGAMPVDAGAVAVAGSAAPHDPLHVTLDAATRLGLLADVIPFPLFRNVYSAGDVLIAAGGFWLPFARLRAS